MYVPLVWCLDFINLCVFLFSKRITVFLIYLSLISFYIKALCKVTSFAFSHMNFNQTLQPGAWRQQRQHTVRVLSGWRRGFFKPRADRSLPLKACCNRDLPFLAPATKDEVQSHDTAFKAYRCGHRTRCPCQKEQFYKSHTTLALYCCKKWSKLLTVKYRFKSMLLN